MEDMDKRIIEVMARQLYIKPERIKPDDLLEIDLGVDSLDKVELMMAFEDEFGSQIPDEDVKKILTVGNAVAYIEGKLKEQEA